jgi:hypothetical protein
MKRSSTARMARFLGSLSVIAASIWTPAANAQAPAPPEDAAPSVTTTPADPFASPTVPAPPPPPPPPPVAAPVRVRQQPAWEPPPERAPTDLDVEKRRFAIGYAGLSQVPIGAPGLVDLTVPAIALRYWVNPTMGLDFGLGIGWQGGSTEVGGTSTDKNGVFGFILQAGLPIALSTRRHVSFQIIPSLAVAHGQTSQPSGLAVGTSAFSGTRIDVGARAGFELFFGFIGIPELALSATVGMQFESRKYTAEDMGITQSDTTLGFSTTVQNNPWDIFAGNVAARYYF